MIEIRQTTAFAEWFSGLPDRQAKIRIQVRIDRAGFGATTLGANMANLKTIPWDSAEHLETEEDMAAYLEAVMEENDPALMTHALGVIARAKGMSQIARDTGLARESLYKALSAEGNPEFATVMKVIKALGLKLHVEAAHG
jgi:probable addiction module antidote protein